MPCQIDNKCTHFLKKMTKAMDYYLLIINRSWCKANQPDLSQVLIQVDLFFSRPEMNICVYRVRPPCSNIKISNLVSQHIVLLNQVYYVKLWFPVCSFISGQLIKIKDNIQKDTQSERVNKTETKKSLLQHPEQMNYLWQNSYCNLWKYNTL